MAALSLDAANTALKIEPCSVVTALSLDAANTAL